MSHEARQAKKRKAAAAESEPSSGSEEDADEEVHQEEESEFEPSKLGRLRHGFLRKVFSPIIGYSTDYELLHFVYDLSMWTTVGAKKNIARQHDLELRVVLKGCPWTPQYWRIRHQLVIDIQRQCGNAALFRTRAPYEKSFPYHEWILHEQRLAGKQRLHLAGPETLHMAHVLMQLDKGFISGGRSVMGRTDRSWTDQHLLGPMPGVVDDTGAAPQTVVSRVTRLEFQDGKRKQGTQKYHGRGTVHSHSLDFLKNMEAIGLDKKLSAHVPEKKDNRVLRGLVLDGQLDRRSSGVPIREEPSAFDPETDRVLLQHTEEDSELHVRPFFPKTLETTKCHEDVMQPEGKGNNATLRYIATYSQKFSDSMDQDWLSNGGTDYSVARRILFSYHPGESEMWLILAAERFPQVDYKGSMVDINVPLPNADKKPMWLKRYESSGWRRDDMSLLEFLRKSSMTSGRIIRHIQESHKQQVRARIEHALMAQGKDAKLAKKEAEGVLRLYRQRLQQQDQETEGALSDFVLGRVGVEVPELEDFANNYISQGEKLVAACVYSMLNDRYYGQWVVLHVPFRQLAELERGVEHDLAKARPFFFMFAIRV